MVAIPFQAIMTSMLTARIKKNPTICRETQIIDTVATRALVGNIKAMPVGVMPVINHVRLTNPANAGNTLYKLIMV
jgi:hypothetical protein